MNDAQSKQKNVARVDFQQNQKHKLRLTEYAFSFAFLQCPNTGV